MQISLWQDTCILPKFSPLKEDIKTDVLIIGGGMAGILCAYFLSQKNIDYVLCEAKTIGGGTSGKTTAVLSAQHDILYRDLINKYGLEYAKLYLQANLEAINDYKKISNEIPCDFELCPSFQYSTQKSTLLIDEINALKKLNFNAKLTDQTPLPVKADVSLCYPLQAQFHPLKFIGGIAKDLNIYENTKIDKIEGTTAFSGKNKIFAKRIIVCTHFPIINKYGLYYTKLYQKNLML